MIRNLNRRVRRSRQKIHAKNRAKERFDIELTSEQYDSLVEQIRDGRAHLVKQLSNTRAIFNLLHEGKDLFAIYHRHTARIATFLPLEFIYGGGR